MQYLYQGYPVPERVRMLEANAAKAEDMTFSRQVDDEELTQLRERFAALNVQLAQIEKEKKEMLAEFKERMKPLKGDAAHILNTLSAETEEVKERVYLFPDHETSKMLIYDRYGVLVKSRRLRPDEKQTDIISSIRKAM